MSATFHGIDADLARQLIDATHEEELARRRYCVEFSKWMVVPRRNILADPLDGTAKATSQIYRACSDKADELARRIWPETPARQPELVNTEAAQADVAPFAASHFDHAGEFPAPAASVQ